MTAPIDMTALTALILVGGLGSRLRTIVQDLPKSLALVNKYPFIHYLLQYVREQKLVDVVLCTGYGANQIKTYCQDGSNWGLQIRYSQETSPLGTAGAIKQAQGLIRSRSFVVLNGDSFVNAHIATMVQYHLVKHAKATVALVDVPDCGRFGTVLVDKAGSILTFREKGYSGPGLINAGIYVLDYSVLDMIPSAQNVSIEQEIFTKLIGQRLCGVEVDKPFIDIGTPSAYKSAPSILANWPI